MVFFFFYYYYISYSCELLSSATFPFFLTLIDGDSHLARLTKRCRCSQQHNVIESFLEVNSKELNSMCAKHRVGFLRVALSPNLSYVDEEFDGCEKFHLYIFSPSVLL